MEKKKCSVCPQLRIFAILFCLIALLLIMMMSKAEAEIYKYTDKNGRKVFVDSLSQVPAEYREQLEIQKPAATVNNTGSLSTNTTYGSTLKQRASVERLQAELRKLETAVEVINNQVFVPVTVTYHGRSVKARMLMDTGASSTVFHRDALERLDPQSRSAGYARVAGGSVIKMRSVNFDSIQVGPHKAKSIRSYVIDNQNEASHFDGLLGMDFLMNASYELNLQRKLIIWNPEVYKQVEAQLSELSSTRKN